jgi:hypothetical protein
MVSRHDSWSDLVRCLVDQHQQRKRAARVEARESGFNACMCVFDSFSEAAKTGIIAMVLTSIANVARMTLIALSSLGDVNNTQSGRNQADSKAYRHVDARVRVQQGEGGEQGVSRQEGGMLFGMQRKRGRSVEDTVCTLSHGFDRAGACEPYTLGAAYCNQAKRLPWWLF